MHEKFEYDKQEKYQKPVDYEIILGQQMSRISQFRSNKDIEMYEESVDTLLLMLPKKLRDQAIKYKRDNNIEYNVANNGKKKYDDLWVFINDLLEEANIIFKTSYIKTYS